MVENTSSRWTDIHACRQAAHSIRRSLPKLGAILLAGIVFTLRTTAVAADISVEFDHVNQPSETSCDPLALTHGESFKVVITNTDTNQFEYVVIGIQISRPPAPGVLAVGTDKKELTLQHDRKYGGYSVRVTRKPGAPVDPERTSKIWYIPVTTVGWETDIAGGFTISDLTNPIYEVRTVGGVSTVSRNQGAEDAVALGLAGFVHVYHGKLPWLAATFGLGITNQSNTAYFLGPSWRWADKGALTLGYGWGSIDRLPSGIHEGDVVTDPNALANRDSRVSGDVFLSFRSSSSPLATFSRSRSRNRASKNKTDELPRSVSRSAKLGGVIKDSQQPEKSRSQIKRDIQALKDLGIRLTDLSKGQLQGIPLSEKTRAAVLAAHGMARNALSRHYRYLSSLLEEEDVAGIRTALTGELKPHVQDVAKQHEAERWRDELLSGDERPLAAFVERYPECDRTRVRLLVRNARKELELGKPPKSARLLFQYVRRVTDPQD